MLPSYPSQHLKHLFTLNQETLVQQSRSFAIPILKLDQPYLWPVLVEYNLNKTIDTIEDHPQLPIKQKIDLINKFCQALQHQCMSTQVKHTMLAITSKNESYVFKNYAATIHLYNHLSPAQQTLALHRTTEMAQGMIDFLNKPIENTKDLNDYCYYVAGSVGLYLTELAKLNESLPTNQYHNLKNHAIGFGRFLQKLNIIRDFVEDHNQRKRCYWPKHLLNQTDNLTDALNMMCADTLLNDGAQAIEYFRHINPINQSFESFIRFVLFSSLEYLKLLRNNPSVFSAKTVKLPKIFIKNLYQRITKLSHEQFLNHCQMIFDKEKETLTPFLYHPT